MLRGIKTIFLLFFFCMGYAQDINFINPFAFPQTINYGFVGVSDGLNFGLVSKLQWPDNVLRSETHMAFADFFLEDSNIGLGIQFTNQTQSKTNYTFNNAITICNYPLKISRKWTATPALYIGFSRMNFNQKRIIFEDQIDLEKGLISPHTLDPIAGRQINTQNYFDFGGGLLLKNKLMWFGFLLKHLNTPNISIVKDKALNLPMFFSFHGGVKIDLSQFFPYLNPDHLNRILMMGNISKKGSNNKIVMNFEYLHKNIGLGTGISMVIKKRHPTQNRINYLMLNTSYQFAGVKINFAYAYEMRSIINTYGIFEVSFLYGIKIDRRMSATPKFF